MTIDPLVLARDLKADELRSRRRRGGIALVVAGVVLLALSWWLVPNGIVLAVAGGGAVGYFVAGGLAIVAGVALLVIGLRLQSAARRSPHAPSSPDGKANPRYQEDQKPKATAGAPLNWIGNWPT